MAWFKDLSTCDYFGLHVANSLRAVGWLQKGHSYPTGVVDAEVYDQLVKLARDPWQPAVAAGPHRCDLCIYEAEASSSANIFLPGDDVLYVCPALITHYMNAHSYAPPTEFCRAVLACPPMRSMAYLKSVRAIGGRMLVRTNPH